MVDWLRDNAWQAWLGLAVLLTVLETFSLDLVLAMLAAGALVGMAAALGGAPGVLQVLLAAGGALALVAVARPPLVRRLHGGPDLVLGAATLVGRPGTVLVAVAPLQPGRVRVDGEEWTAAPSDEASTYDVGTTVEVVEIRGATAYVRPAAAPGA